MPKMVIKSVAEVERSRKNLRRGLMLAGLPFLALILFFAYQTASVYISAQQIVTLTEQGKYEEASKAAEKQKETTFIEPDIAEFNNGVAKYNNKEYIEAISSFEKILQEGAFTDDTVKLCALYDALSKTYEAEGDRLKEEGKPVEAERSYLLGRQTVSAAPEECFPPPPPDQSNPDDGDQEDNGSGTGDGESGEGSGQEQSSESDQQKAQEFGKELQETDSRLEEKLGQKPSPGSEPDEPSDDKLDEEGKRDQVQDQIDGNQADRDADEGTVNPDAPPADKPW